MCLCIRVNNVNNEITYNNNNTNEFNQTLLFLFCLCSRYWKLIGPYFNNAMFIYLLYELASAYTTTPVIKKMTIEVKLYVPKYLNRGL